jgi:hypothetical protein
MPNTAYYRTWHITFPNHDIQIMLQCTENILYLSECKMTLIRDNPTKLKCLLRKNILLLTAYTYYIKYVRFYLPVPISVTDSISTVSALNSSHSLLIFPSSSLSFHNILSVSSTALDTCTAYNPSQSLLVRCTAMPLWFTLTKYYICILLFINFLEPWRSTIFSKMVLAVLRI